MELPAMHSEQMNSLVGQGIESLQLSKCECSQQSRPAAAPDMMSFVAIHVFVPFIVLFKYFCIAQVFDYKGLEPFCLNDVKLTQCIASDEESLKCAAIDPNDQVSLANCVCAQSMFNSYMEYVPLCTSQYSKMLKSSIVVVKNFERARVRSSLMPV